MVVEVDTCQVWAGPMGTLVPIPNSVGEVSAERERPMSVQTAITGARTVQYAPLSRRAWKVSATGLTPAERGTIEGAYMAGTFPWTLTTIDAWRHNLLTPEQSMFQGLKTLAGPVSLPGDRLRRIPSMIAPNRLVSGGWYWHTIGRVPAVPDAWVTGSSWIKRWPQSSAIVAILFRDGAGKVLDRKDTYTAPDDLTRSSASALTPAGAVDVELAVCGGEFAAPAISWTREMTEWSAGMGCLTAMPTPPSFTLNPKYPDVRWDLSMMFTEIG